MVHPAVLSVILIFLLTSCSKESASREAPEADTIIDGGTCLYLPEDGESASRMEDPPTRSDATEFGKNLDLRFVQGVLRTSMLETAKFIETAGVQLVQVQTPRRYTCSPLSFLPFSSSSLNAFWNDRQQPGRTLLGMFLPRLDSDNPDRRATILIRPDTTRWTLVHEFIHALYEFERDRMGSPTSDAQWTALNQAIDALDREFDVCERGPCVNVRETLQALTNYVNLRHAIELSYAMEEIAIEAQLSRKYAKKELRYVPNETDSSHWYARNNLEKSSAAFERTRNNLRWFSKRSVEAGAQSSSDAAAAESRILAEWRSTLDRARALTAEIELLLRSQSKFNSQIKTRPIQARDCSHSDVHLPEPDTRSGP